MAQFKISGVWKNQQNVITDYAFHEVKTDSIGRAKKTSKAEAIRLLESGHSAITWLWNYRKAYWEDGERVEVVNGLNGKYLRSNRDNTLTDNLGHLIDYDWIQ